MVLVSSCKQLQENQAVAWILKTKEKYPPKQESLVFLETTVHMVGEKAENQRKTREKSKVYVCTLSVFNCRCVRNDWCAVPWGVGHLLIHPIPVLHLLLMSYVLQYNT